MLHQQWNHPSSTPTPTPTDTASHSVPPDPIISRPNLSGISCEDILHFLQAAGGSISNGGGDTKPNPSSDLNKFEALLGIEKSDENFHKHSLIKHLRKLIDASVGHLLDDQISRLTSDSHDSTVPLIVDRIMTSPEYLNLVAMVADQVRKSVANLNTTESSPQPTNSNSPPKHSHHPHSNIHQHQQQQHPHHNLVLRPFNNSISSHGGFNENYHHSFSTHSNATNDSSSGSLTSSSFMSPPVEEVKLIISNLQSKNALDVRVAAAQKFNLLSIADLLSSEFWADTKLGIELSLADHDVRVSGIGLRVCSKVFKSSPPPMTGELFLILVQHLINVFESGNAPKLGDGLNLSEPRIDLLLRKFRLLLQFQLELPSCWLRFPDQMFCNCLNATYRLLRKPKRAPSSIGALHIISVLDPIAGWFEKWTLSCVGRAQSVASIGKADLAVDLVTSFLTYLSTIPLESGEKFPMSSNVGKLGGNDEVLVMDVEANEDADKGESDDSAEDADRFISSWDLEYMHFCQVLVVLGKLIRGRAGRLCFPVTLDIGGLKWKEGALSEIFGDSKDKVVFTVEMFLQIQVILMCKCRRIGPSKINFDDPKTVSDEKYGALHLSTIICHLLQDLTLTEESSKLVHTNKIVSELINPVKRVVENQTQANVNERILINIAHLLSTIASSESGRKLILRGENAKSHSDSISRKNESKVLQTLIKFVVDSLEGVLQPSPTLSLQVLGAFIFFLRQLYRTCEGVQLLQKYTLHRALTKNMGDSKWFHKWNQVGSIEISRREWETMTIDNLLNFAGTPKGVLLLHESGAMEQCVAHMFHRYQKKMQVSACEKFGYGVLVSQVSVTGPGMKALCKTGLIGSYLKNLWDLLEFDNPLGEPEVEIDDYHSRKMVSSMLKSLSSFSGLSAILEFEEGQPTQGNNSFIHVMHKLLLTDRPITNDPLVTFDESKQIGLRMLSLVTASLDSCILLQSRFRFQESLLKQQEEALVENQEDHDTNEEFVIDENSMMRNKILATTYIIGGPRERLLPQIDAQLYVSQKMTMFSQFPAPSCYTTSFNGICIDVENKDVLMLRQTLLDSSMSQETFYQSVQKHILSINKSMPMMPLRIMNQTIQKLLSMYSSLPLEKAGKLGWTLIMDYSDELPDFPKHLDLNASAAVDLGISMVVRYAKRLLPADRTLNSKRDIIDLLRRVNFLLDPTIHQHSGKVGKQSKPSVSNSMRFTGFDWFTATMFIMNECSIENTLSFLQQFKCFSASCLLWPVRGLHRCLQSKQISMDFNNTIPLSYSCSSYFVELMLEEELPHIFSAFTLSGCTPSQLSNRWIRECFWNVLDFPEIANYIFNTIAFGVDYQVYYCISVLRHLERQILNSTRMGGLIMFLNDGAKVGDALKGFRVDVKVLEYMKELEGRYREVIFSDLTVLNKKA
ncbi:broad-minded protein-domain-containing protein [Obelidium mucronatum]|nr:broad-minded protein-domain-containing protein [Obelidium mucronatum]